MIYEMLNEKNPKIKLSVDESAIDDYCDLMGWSKEDFFNNFKKTD